VCHGQEGESKEGKELCVEVLSVPRRAAARTKPDSCLSICGGAPCWLEVRASSPAQPTEYRQVPPSHPVVLNRSESQAVQLRLHDCPLTPHT